MFWDSFLFSSLPVTLPLSIGWWVLVSSHRCLGGCLFKTHVPGLIFPPPPLMDLTDVKWILWHGKWLVSCYGIGFGLCEIFFGCSHQKPSRYAYYLPVLTDLAIKMRRSKKMQRRLTLVPALFKNVDILYRHQHCSWVINPIYWIKNCSIAHLFMCFISSVEDGNLFTLTLQHWHNLPLFCAFCLWRK